MRKQYFLLWKKETAFFPFLYHGIIFYSAELLDCAINFKFYLNIFIFLQHKHKSGIKGDQPYKETLEVKYQACNFAGVLSFASVFEDFGHIFLTCFCRTSHNLICNKFAILRNKKTY